MNNLWHNITYIRLYQLHLFHRLNIHIWYKQNVLDALKFLNWIEIFELWKIRPFYYLYLLWHRSDTCVFCLLSVFQIMSVCLFCCLFYAVRLVFCLLKGFLLVKNGYGTFDERYIRLGECDWVREALLWIECECFDIGRTSLGENNKQIFRSSLSS